MQPDMLVRPDDEAQQSSTDPLAAHMQRPEQQQQQRQRPPQQQAQPPPVVLTATAMQLALRMRDYCELLRRDKPVKHTACFVLYADILFDADRLLLFQDVSKYAFFGLLNTAV